MEETDIISLPCLMDGKIESASSYLRNMDNKKLYGFCKPKNG